ncbi:MAG: amidase [Candidatus Dormibacteraeota bacterium]|uniref:Amidase n=1 Tax=Candidatus Dormiibacter inghamiae TaxID=3127013 RepID=A0A934K902_9BACT|nr:amidase [Candidatus Dormibacteraeota bacterium]MBJ7606615.1 amidase [Candidatus Dormibacteraeota bacterium]
MTAAEARERARARAALGAFISLTEEDGPGPAVAVKDLVDVAGTVTTAGGIQLRDRAAIVDALVVRRLREAGCVVMGKANLHEFAFGLTSENPHYGPVRNPHDSERVAGGSSGGSAAAVAARLCDWALGTDTGGSIRVPAAYCGVVGFKPTVGTVPTEGVFPLSHSLDTVGPLARDVRTAALALEAMSELRGLLPERTPSLTELRLAIPTGWLEGVEPEIAHVFTAATRGLPELELPDRLVLGRPGLIILLAEAGSLHRRWLEDTPERYGADVRALLEQGLRVSRRDYSLALLEQSRARLAAESAMADIDAILVPATGIMPPRIGAEYDRAAVAGWTRPFNTTGQPVICLPAPTSGLPVGIQVVGRFGQEARLVEASLALEAAWAQVTG